MKPGKLEILIHIITTVLIVLCLLFIFAKDANAGKHYGYNNPGPGMVHTENVHASDNDAVSASVSSQDNRDLVNLDLSNNSRVNSPDIPVATAVAPNLVANECIGSMSGAAQGVKIGIAIGGTKEHEKCNRRSNATVMWQGSEVSINAGDHDTAKRERHAARCVLANDPEMRVAYESAGIYCGDMVIFAKRQEVIELDREIERNRRIEKAKAGGWAGTKSGVYSYPDGN